MKNTLTQRLVMGLLALFLLSYVGYQAWRYFTSQYKTETVYTYTVAETAGITGIAPVSYTHLDVYKRQTTGCSATT